MTISGYGLMISLGGLAALGTGYLLCKRLHENFYDLLIFAVYAAAVGMLGAKVLYLLQNLRQIQWDRMGDWNYVQSWLSGGFVFYGGLIGGALGGFLAVKIHRIPAGKNLRLFLPLLPLAHGFGRIGCTLAGCCHGVAYHGPLAIIYDHSLFAPNGVALFPVQAAEAVLLFVIAAALVILLLRGARLATLVLTYLISYSLGRFLLEFLRGDAVRGTYGIFSTSQWISLVILAGVGIWFLFRRRGKAQTHS